MHIELNVWLYSWSYMFWFYSFAEKICLAQEFLKALKKIT